MPRRQRSDWRPRSSWRCFAKASPAYCIDSRPNRELHLPIHVTPRIGIDALVCGAGALAAGAGAYLVVLAAAAFRYRDPQLSGSTSSSTRPVAVVIPAHDEALLVGRCVASLRHQSYPARLVDIVVIADNCSDQTAAVAAAAGATVLVRDQPAARGKGRALRWASDQLLARRDAPDAIIVVDADSVADHEFVSGLVRCLEAGADAAQGESLLFDDATTQGALRAAAFLLINRVRPAGRAVLGLPCSLVGNGMLLSRELLVAHPWDAFTSAEDTEYTLRLRMAGVRPVFAGGAVLHTPPAPNPQAAEQQRLRWEGGKLHLARRYLPRLVAAAVRHRRVSLLDSAIDLAIPPLGLLAAAILIVVIIVSPLVVAGYLAWWALAPWLVALAAIPVFVVVGLRAADAPASAYRALAGAPRLVIRKTIGMRRLLAFRADSWVRTERRRD